MALKAPAAAAAAEVLPVRLVFLGAAGVGKTALIRRFLHDAFEPRHRRTVEELHVLEMDLDPEPPGGYRAPARRLRLRLEVLDTSGSYSFPAMRRLCIRHGDAFALVCSPHEPGSVEEAERLRREILEARRDAPPLVVAVNKSDLGPGPGTGGGGGGGLAEELAETVEGRWGARCLPVSAKQNHNVAQLFQDLLAQARLPVGSLSPALRRRSNPEVWPKEPAAEATVAAARGRPVKRPSCALC